MSRYKSEAIYGRWNKMSLWNTMPLQKGLFLSLIHLGVKAKGIKCDLDLWQMTLIRCHQWHILTYQTSVFWLGWFWNNSEMLSFYNNFWTDRHLQHNMSPIFRCRGFTLSQTTNFRLVRTERVCRQQFQI